MGNKFVNDFTIDMNDNVFAGADLNGVYMSTNEGNNWTHLGLNCSIYTLGWDANLNLCAGGLSSGVSRFTSSDSTWKQIYNQGYTAVESDIICCNDFENIYVGTNWWGLYKTTDKGQFWERTGFSGTVKDIFNIDDSTLILDQPNGLYISRDSGHTWSQIGNYNVSTMFYDPIEHTIFIGTYASYGLAEIYSSTDLGQNWEFLASLGHNCMASWINSIYVTKNEHYLFANSVCASHNGTGWDFYRSTDGGKTWELKSEEIVNNITENSDGYLYAISDNRLMLSLDIGETWITRDIQASCLSIDNMNRIYIGNGHIIMASDKEALDWTMVGNQLTTVVNDITITKNKYIYLATDSGVYFGDISNFVLSIKDKNKLITSFILYQNYPNPFNPTTKIKYHLPELSKVKLTVYDVLGREIKIFVSEEKPAGSYEVEFSAKGGSASGGDLSSGIYIYRIETSKFSATKKFILLK